MEGNWIVEICNGGVDRLRERISLSNVPEKPPGEFYATWIAECAGMFWAPWIIWDVDEKSLPDALRRTQALVDTLQGHDVPDDALRVVFSTNKGFHVYLDSRTVGLTPSRTLHADLRMFCLRIMATDRSLYDSRRVIGVPNSKHRKTQRRYTILSLDMLTSKDCEIADIQALTLVQREIPPRAASVDPIPSLMKFLTAEKISGLSSKALARIATESLPEFNGVGEGERDAAAFKLANYYKRLALSEQETLILCKDANTRNRPPLPDGMIREKVWRVYQK